MKAKVQSWTYSDTGEKKIFRGREVNDEASDQILGNMARPQCNPTFR